MSHGRHATVASRRHRWAIALLAAVFAIPAVALAAGRFSDVPASSPFFDDIEWVADAGVTLGCGDGTEYCPTDNVTRQQMAAFMHRLAKYFGAEDGVVSNADMAANADKLDGIDSRGFVPKLHASVNATCTAVDRHTGVVGVDLAAPARCDVQFNQSVSACTPIATIRSHNGGEIEVATSRDGAFVGLADNEIGVVFRDSSGALTGPYGFHLMVICGAESVASSPSSAAPSGPEDQAGRVVP